MKVNWKKLYKEAPEAVKGKRYTGEVLHVVPTRWKHDSGYRAFTTYLVRKNSNGECKPTAVRLYHDNDVVSFGGLAPYSGPSQPIRMDMRMDGVMQFWADEEMHLSVAVVGWGNCDVRVVP